MYHLRPLNSEEGREGERMGLLERFLYRNRTKGGSENAWTSTFIMVSWVELGREKKKNILKRGLRIS